MTTAIAKDALRQLWTDFTRDRSNQELRNRLLEVLLPIVGRHAAYVQHQLGGNAEMDDLISAGVFGLMDAIDAYDLSRGVKFETYCVPRIRGAMLDEVRRVDWIPRSVRIKAKRLATATKAMGDILGRLPTHDELAAELELSLLDLDRVVVDAQAPQVVSLNRASRSLGGDKECEEISDARGVNPTRPLASAGFLRDIARGLTQTERLIVILYYYEELTMEEIGDSLGLSGSRISQLLARIIRHLRARYGVRKPQHKRGPALTPNPRNL